MRDILADIYNKVLNFFQAEREGNSKDIATNRLKLVLMQDRTNLDSLTLEKMRNELIDVISKYVEIDKEALGLNLAGEGHSMALMLNIPVLRAKTQEEINEAFANEEVQENFENNDNDVQNQSDEINSDECSDEYCVVENEENHEEQFNDNQGQHNN